jgi:deoxyribonuclease V
MDRKNIHHPWNLSLKRAAALQTELSRYVSLTPLKEEPRIIVGVDSADWNDIVFIAVVVMDAETGKTIQIVHSHAHARFGYIAGYRAYREAPIALKAIKSIDYEPDLFFFAGQGVCHPRLCGMASHLG